MVSFLKHCSNSNEYTKIAALIVLFFASVFVVICSLVFKSIPLWLYITASLSLGAVIVLSVLMFSKGRKVALTYFFIIVLALIMWNFFSISTKYNMIAFRDSYQEMVYLKLILADGHLDLTPQYINLAISPGNSEYYPLYSVLASAFALITGFEPLRVGVLLPFFVSLFTFLSSLIFVRRVLDGSKIKNIAIPLAMIAFVISPSMVSNSTFYYHRELAIGFAFLIFYFMLKYLAGELSNSRRLILVVLVFLLPFTHSLTPYRVATFIFTLSLLILMLRFLCRDKLKSIMRIKSPIFLFLILFTVCFLWNFMLIASTSSPVSSGFLAAARNTITSLFYPQIDVKVGEITSSISPIIPYVLRPEPWIILPRVREILLDVPLLLVSVFLLYKLIKRMALGNDALVLLFIVSFVPIIVGDVLSWWNVFAFRIYMFPLIAYCIGVLYGSLMKSKIRIIQVTASIIMVFMIAVALLAPFGSLYSRQLYDSSVAFGEADFPNPSYVNLGKFISTHQFGNGSILSDFDGLLIIVLPPQHFERIKGLSTYYGEPDTYVVEFVGLKTGAGVGDISGLALEQISNKTKAIRSTINYDYNIVADAGPYVIHYKPDSTV